MQPLARMPDFSVGPFILMYHAVQNLPGDRYSVTVDAFRRQLAWLCTNGFGVATLESLWRALEEGDLRDMRRKVVLTFDDGTSDFLSHALPVLGEHGACATVFLVTGLLGKEASWTPAGATPLMSEEEVRGIKRLGISLGSHTASHARLTGLEPGELRRELHDSRQRLTDLGEEFSSFAYPFGQYSPAVVEAVRQAGYRCAVAAGEATALSRDNRFLLPRIAVTRDLDLARFGSLLTRTCVGMEMRRRYRALRRIGSRARSDG